MYAARKQAFGDNTTNRVGPLNQKYIEMIKSLIHFDSLFLYKVPAVF